MPTNPQLDGLVALQAARAGTFGLTDSMVQEDSHPLDVSWWLAKALDSSGYRWRARCPSLVSQRTSSQEWLARY